MIVGANGSGKTVNYNIQQDDIAYLGVLFNGCPHLLLWAENLRPLSNVSNIAQRESCLLTLEVVRLYLIRRYVEILRKSDDTYVQLTGVGYALFDQKILEPSSSEPLVCK